MKRELISSIQERGIRQHIDKSEVCSDLYNKVLLEKAILKKQLEDLQNNSIVNRIKHLLPRQEKLICDYFKR